MTYRHHPVGDRLWKCSPNYDPDAARQIVEDAIWEGRGRPRLVAEALGISERQLERHIKRFGLGRVVDSARRPMLDPLQRARALLRGDYR